MKHYTHSWDTEAGEGNAKRGEKLMTQALLWTEGHLCSSDSFTAFVTE